MPLLHPHTTCIVASSLPLNRARNRMLQLAGVGGAPVLLMPGRDCLALWLQVRSGGVDVLVVDSVAALVPRAELDGEMGDHHIALQARLMSQALRKLTASLSRSNTLIIFINQVMKRCIHCSNVEWCVV